MTGASLEEDWNSPVKFEGDRFGEHEDSFDGPSNSVQSCREFIEQSSLWIHSVSQ